MLLPWWVKISSKLVLSKLPLGYGLWQRLGLFRHGQMDVSEYAIRVFEQHVERAGLANAIAGKTVLEIGPGDSLSSAVIAAAYGARAVLLDSGPYAREDVTPYRELQAELKERGLSAPDLSTCRNTDEVLALCGARYHTGGFASFAQIESDSIDLIFSQAVLEHVRKAEFLATQQECRRVLRPGGVCSHRVDLRDHLGGALNNLRFSESMWESEFFARSGFYTNRISFARMILMFERAGFTVQVNDVRRWSALPTPRHKLAPEFRDLPEQELCVSGFDVLLR